MVSSGYPGHNPAVDLEVITADVTGEKADTSVISLPISEPAVTWGRMTGNIWLRLLRKGNNFEGFFSYDGKAWKDLPGAE